MESLEDFYNHEERKTSREVSFGSNWRSPGAPHHRFTVFWVADTGELCVERTPLRDVQQDGAFRRWIVGTPPHFRTNPLRDEDVSIKVLCQLDEGELHEALAGWEEQLVALDGLSWLISRTSETKHDERPS